MLFENRAAPQFKKPAPKILTKPKKYPLLSYKHILNHPNSFVLKFQENATQE